MLEYGSAFLEQNEEAIATLTKRMTPAALALAEQMAEEQADDELADAA